MAGLGGSTSGMPQRVWVQHLGFVTSCQNLKVSIQKRKDIEDVICLQFCNARGGDRRKCN